MRILYVGDLWFAGTCLQRMEAMRELGNDVVPVDTLPENVHKKQNQLFYRAIGKLFGPFDLAGVNQKIIELKKEKDIHLLWIDKGLTIRAEILMQIHQLGPKTIVAGYSPDDMAAKHNQSRNFLKGLPYYNIYFTTKSYNVKELKDLGCPLVFFVGNAYDPKTHSPIDVTEGDRIKYGGSVGFIGGYERERAESMLYLAENGISIRVWGPNWSRKIQVSHPNLKIEGKPLRGEEYVKAICSFDINLAFLRKINRDLQTTRSIEIPACSAFMLAERTNEHLELFEEGKEAEFFETKEELFEKVRYYLNHDEERKNIAKAGRERCLKSGYSNHKRIEIMLGLIEDLRGKN